MWQTFRFSRRPFGRGQRWRAWLPLNVGFARFGHRISGAYLSVGKTGRGFFYCPPVRDTGPNEETA